MKQKKYQGLLLLMLGTLVLGGCQEAPYQLTETEEALIVSYSSHIISKYNIYQKDGLVYVADSEEMDEVPQKADTETNTESDTEQEVINTEIVSGNVGGSTEETIKGELDSVYGDTGLTISYETCEIADSYMDNSMYAARPSVGKNFLIIHLSVENQTEEAIEFQNFGSNTNYSANFQMDDGKWYLAPSVISLVSNEFSTFEGTIGAGETKDMVLLFEIPQQTSEINSLILKINRNGKNFEINL